MLTSNLGRSNIVETSPDTIVRFKGWKSTLYELQLNGWSVACDYCPVSRKQHIVIDDQKTILRGTANVSIYEYLDRGLNGFGHMRDKVEVHFGDVSHHPAHNIMTFQGIPKINEHSSGFREVDCRPTLVELENLGKIFSQGIFNYKQENETLVEAADMEVVDMLEAIVHKQAQKQKELRAKAYKDSESIKKGVNLLLVS